jgi:phosphoketolase
VDSEVRAGGNYVNLIVIDKQPQLRFLDMETAIRHCENAASIWHRASNDNGGEPDAVLGSAGASRARDGGGRLVPCARSCRIRACVS